MTTTTETISTTNEKMIAYGEELDFVVEENEVAFDSNDVEVFEDLLDHCPPQNSRGLFWNWTMAGDEAIQVCPSGSSGFARWQCGQDGQWETSVPNFGDCYSSWVGRLEARMHANGEIAHISSELALKTYEKKIFGGDVAIVTSIIQGLAHRLRQDIYKLSSQEIKDIKATKLLEDSVKTASNLLDDTQANAWTDLTGDRKASLATALIVGIEENALLLAETINNEKNIVEKTNNVLASIKILRSRNVQDQAFPYETEDLQLVLPSESLIETSVNGAIRVASFLFDNLDKILPGAGSYFINSKVLHTLVPTGQNERLTNPIYFVLRHLKSENVRNPVCASWNYNLRTWSNKDCVVVKTNMTHTMCQCHRISNFAVLMEERPANAEPRYSSSTDETDSIQLLTAVIAGSLVVVILVVITSILIRRRCIRKQNSDFYTSSAPPTVSTVYSEDNPSKIYSTQLHNHRLLFNSPNLMQNHQQPQPFQSNIYNEIIDCSSSSDGSEFPSPQMGSRVALIGQPQPPLMMQRQQQQQQQQYQQLEQLQAITLRDGNQFVRLKLADPYAVAAGGQQIFKI
jgi:hypothetical protein